MTAVRPDDTAAPALMFGDEGETVFVRQDLAATETGARKVALADGIDTAHMDLDVVLMLPVPEHFVVEEDWWTVRDGTPGAVAYWRFRA